MRGLATEQILSVYLPAGDLSLCLQRMNIWQNYNPKATKAPNSRSKSSFSAYPHNCSMYKYKTTPTVKPKIRKCKSLGTSSKGMQGWWDDVSVFLYFYSHCLQWIHDPHAKDSRIQAYVRPFLHRCIGQYWRPTELHVSPVVQLALGFSVGFPTFSKVYFPTTHTVTFWT